MADQNDEEIARELAALGLERLPSLDNSRTKKGNSLKEGLNFFEAFLDEIVVRSSVPGQPDDSLDPQRITLESLAEMLGKASHSSAFSGIAAPETALLGLHRAVQARVAYEDGPQIIFSIVEWLV